MTFVDYECAGLVLRSSIPIAAPIIALDRDVDSQRVVTIELGEARPLPFARPSTEVIAEVVRDGTVWSSVCQVGESYVARFFGVCEFEISGELNHVRCIPDEAALPGIVPILLTGSVVALILSLRGWCVLHASAVEIAGRALALLGSSGQGKTTLAALLCAAGAPLVTDDVLPLEFGEISGIKVLRSTSELRLRPKARELIERFSGSMPERVTADDRFAIAPIVTKHDRLELQAIVIPIPSRTAEEARARHLDLGEASLWLGRCARVEGWRRVDEVRRHFSHVTRIVGTVPVLELVVPWGPPYAPDLAVQVLDALDESLGTIAASP